MTNRPYSGGKNAGAFRTLATGGTYEGELPTAPTPPTVPEVAPPATAPALGLNLSPIIFIVSGDVQVSSQVRGMSVERR